MSMHLLVFYYARLLLENAAKGYKCGGEASTKLYQRQGANSWSSQEYYRGEWRVPWG